MAESKEFWAFSEKPALLAELIGGASELAAARGGTPAAVVLGPQAEADRAFSLGAQKVYWLGEPGERLVDDYVPTLAAMVQQSSPAVLLIGATSLGKAVAGRLAVGIGATTVTDLKAVETEGDGFRVRHMIFGGGAVREEKPKAGLLLATAGTGVFQPRAADSGQRGETVSVPFVEPAWHAVLRGSKPRPPASVNLAAARRVVCAGRGIARREDLGMVTELAGLLGAEVACSRPLAEGLDWLPRERYIGVSGANIRPALYLAVGVSGQVQHMVGAGDSRVIAAINKDQNAPIFEQADYGIVGDLYAVVPALIQALKGRK
ncbi:MAG TPA: electron transfer flavoprotein subunit alpha/FixB family protein [Anaerolineaceae bacterium]